MCSNTLYLLYSETVYKKCAELIWDNIFEKEKVLWLVLELI